MGRLYTHTGSEIVGGARCRTVFRMIVPVHSESIQISAIHNRFRRPIAKSFVSSVGVVSSVRTVCSRDDHWQTHATLLDCPRSMANLVAVGASVCERRSAFIVKHRFPMNFFSLPVEIR